MNKKKIILIIFVVCLFILVFSNGGGTREDNILYIQDFLDEKDYQETPNNWVPRDPKWRIQGE